MKPLVERFQEVGILVNEFNRTVGLIDLVPEVIVDPVVEKLDFIHALVKRSARKPRVQDPFKFQRPTNRLQLFEPRPAKTA